MRGGVSSVCCLFPDRARSSPRAWGCFLHALADFPDFCVFPTCVGVFLLSSRFCAAGDGLPHVRGGVSAYIDNAPDLYTSSPRAWGCFSVHFGRVNRGAGLPHVRGGVSLYPC